MTSQLGDLVHEVTGPVSAIAGDLHSGARGLMAHYAESPLEAVHDAVRDYLDFGVALTAGYFATRYGVVEGAFIVLANSFATPFFDDSNGRDFRVARNLHGGIGGLLIGTGNSVNVALGAVASATSLALDYARVKSVRAQTFKRA